MAIRNYSPTDVSVLLGGFYQLDGFVDGTFITISKDVSPYETTRTSDGEIARTYKSDDSYTVSFTIAQSSPSNDVLTKLHQVDAFTQLGRFPLFVKDELGTSIFLSTSTWIKEIPDISYGPSIESREWVLQASGTSFNVGNNETASDAIQDAANLISGAVPSIQDFV